MYIDVQSFRGINDTASNVAPRRKSHNCRVFFNARLRVQFGRGMKGTTQSHFKEDVRYEDVHHGDRGCIHDKIFSKINRKCGTRSFSQGASFSIKLIKLLYNNDHLLYIIYIYCLMKSNLFNVCAFG